MAEHLTPQKKPYAPQERLLIRRETCDGETTFLQESDLTPSERIIYDSLPKGRRGRYLGQLTYALHPDRFQELTPALACQSCREGKWTCFVKREGRRQSCVCCRSKMCSFVKRYPKAPVVPMGIQPWTLAEAGKTLQMDDRLIDLLGAWNEEEDEVSVAAAGDLAPFQSAEQSTGSQAAEAEAEAEVKILKRSRSSSRDNAKTSTLPGMIKAITASHYTPDIIHRLFGIWHIFAAPARYLVIAKNSVDNEQRPPLLLPAPVGWGSEGVVLAGAYFMAPLWYSYALQVSSAGLHTFIFIPEIVGEPVTSARMLRGVSRQIDDSSQHRPDHQALDDVFEAYPAFAACDRLNWKTSYASAPVNCMADSGPIAAELVRRIMTSGLESDLSQIHVTPESLTALADPLRDTHASDLLQDPKVIQSLVASVRSGDAAVIKVLEGL